MSRAGHGVQACLSWMPGQHGQVPYNAIAAAPGLYICRARCDQDVVPGKVPQGHTTAYVPYDGRENPMPNYEVLCDTGLHCFGAETDWASMSGGKVPKRALVAGNTRDREPLYVGRARISGEWCVGKVHPSHGCAYFPWGGEEHRQHNYEVLCFREN